MAFLDNSGDIILDAVLTDTGRMRLAKGDGSFRIVKFALADDEIDYSLYDGNNSSGSAYYDLEILQTPVLEAFSNNMASMKSKLISISRNNLLHLPVIIPNNLNVGAEYSEATALINNGFILAADSDTEVMLNGNFDSTISLSKGTIKGVSFNGGAIRVDQGINNSQDSNLASQPVEPDLLETQYIVELDNRFVSLIPRTTAANQSAVNRAVPSYIDDDNIASYYFSRGVDTEYVDDIPLPNPLTTDTSNVIAGPKGTLLQFKLASQNEIIQSNYLFNQLGFDLDETKFSGSPTTVKAILTNITVSGVTTGASLSIPLLIVKKIV